MKHIRKKHIEKTRTKIENKPVNPELIAKHPSATNTHSSTTKDNSTSVSRARPVILRSDDPKKVKKLQNSMERGDVWYILDHHRARKRSKGSADFQGIHPLIIPKAVPSTQIPENQKAWRCNTNLLIEAGASFDSYLHHSFKTCPLCETSQNAKGKEGKGKEGECYPN
ncbi:hypothetical protein COCMIDRAFT_30915 [Bipolaris oryzae ATCC 44560]|uniref:Uncharacterized protein n=1 Tax=Bipolaris oryzae ATCC 44560 TaxID=930090 RepID=W6YRD5_COCMI|nr:uncharacterized protein COCMIDRAFT_30915 [Bipolaris oryzae ATCC 44560]EUC40078.1 hypothetical protein COCMIDRAFT_30915 [Bipolaris oryzae ATCC 44560]